MRVSVKKKLKLLNVLDSRRPLTCAFRSWERIPDSTVEFDPHIDGQVGRLTGKTQVGDNIDNNGTEKRFAQGFERVPPLQHEKHEYVSELRGMSVRGFSRGFRKSYNVHAVKIIRGLPNVLLR